MSDTSGEVVVTGGYRTPFSRYGGTLRGWSSIDIGSFLLATALPRLNLPPEEIDVLVCGTGFQAEVANHTNITARQILLKAGLPETTVSLTVDRASCTGMAAVIVGWQAIRAGQADVVVAIGSEALGNTPFLLSPSIRWGNTRGNFQIRDPLFPMRFPARPGSIIEDVDDEANHFDVTREDMDRWAYESQMRYEKARKEGYYEDELLPVPLDDGETFAADEAPRPTTSLEKLSTLKTVHGSDLITAGNAPGMETGAAMIVMMRAETARSRGLKPLVSMPVTCSVAGELTRPLSQSARATTKLLRKADLRLEQLDSLDIEEDFAAVVPISARVLEKDWGMKEEDFYQRTNIHGGAIAMGHPIGASGVRQVLTLARHMRAKPDSFGVAAVAGGLAQGDAVLLHTPS